MSDEIESASALEAGEHSSLARHEPSSAVGGPDDIVEEEDVIETVPRPGDTVEDPIDIFKFVKQFKFFIPIRERLQDIVQNPAEAKEYLRDKIARFPRAMVGRRKVETCQVCEGYRYPYPYTVRVHRLLRSAQKGCSMCSVIIRALTFFYAPHEMENWISKVDVYIPMQWEDQGPLIICLNHRAVEVFSKLHTTYSLGPYSFNPRSILRHNTSSPQTWEIVKGWLHQCAQNHKDQRCSVDIGQHQLPKRVLDLGLGLGRDMHSQADVKLYESLEEDRGRYVCLSHCWGPNGCASKTETHNLETHKRKISIQGLPKTFQDAVVFTRWLGIRWLWIDALCILQDSPQDWKQQAAVMGTIYEHSYLTLSASHAFCGADGLFQHKDRASLQHSLSPLPGFTREPIYHSPINGGEEEHKQGVFPILYRAWTFQERLLSPRILHFGNQELSWQCRTMVACECQPAINTEVFHPGPRTIWNNQLASPMSQQDQDNLSNKLNAWNKLVQFYSRLDVTYPSDRLPAIMGLARRFGQTMPGAQYLDGIWKNDPKALLWEVDTFLQDKRPTYRQTISTADKDYIAPSWSWAVVNSPIQYPYWENSTIFYKVLGHDCEPPYERYTTNCTPRHMLVLEGQIEHCTDYDYDELKEGSCRFSNGLLWGGIDSYFFKWDYRDISPKPKISLLILACSGVPEERKLDTYENPVSMILQNVNKSEYLGNSSTTSKLPIYRRLGLLELSLWHGDPVPPGFGLYSHNLDGEAISEAQSLFTKTERIALI